MNAEHNFSAVCVRYAYAGMFYLLSYIAYYFSVVLIFVARWKKQSSEMKTTKHCDFSRLLTLEGKILK